MDNNNTHNITRGLVQAILTLTEEQRRVSSVQSLCQFIYCIFPTNGQDVNNNTCRVTAAKLYLSDEKETQENLYFVLIAKYISLYIYPIFIFMGIFGNSLSCFIMFLNVRRNGYPANFYLTLLAFVDCLFLLGSALPNWLAGLHQKLDIRLLSNLCCRIVYWFGNFITHLSAGLVVSVTVERFIAIQYPLIAHRINTVTHTHIVLVILIAFFFLLDSRVLVLVKYFTENVHIVWICNNDIHIKYERRDMLRCDITNEYHEQTWVFIDFAVYTLIPFLSIVTLNSLIIHRLIQAQRERQRMFHFNKTSMRRKQEKLHRNLSEGHQRVVKKHSHLRRCQSVPSTTSLAVILHPQINQHRLQSNVKQSPSENKFFLEIKMQSSHSIIRQTTNNNNIRLTILLLFVSCSFLVLTLPAVVLNLILSTKSKTSSSLLYNNLNTINEIINSDTILYYTLARLLMIINHSINFILYFVVGKRFRRDLKKLFIDYGRKLSRQQDQY